MVIEKSIEEKLLCLRRKHWAMGIFAAQAVIMILMLGSYGTSSWVKQSSNGFNWTGGLLRITDGNKEWEEVEYIDMYASCDQLSIECKVFRQLRSAGAAFCFFDVIAYLFTIIWMIHVTFAILQQPFLEKIPALVWPSAGLGCHILAEIIWSGATGASFNKSCKYGSSDLCALNGPALVLAVTCIYILTFAAYIVFHIKGKVVEEE
jgi:hypothetical protein